MARRAPDCSPRVCGQVCAATVCGTAVMSRAQGALKHGLAGLLGRWHSERGTTVLMWPLLFVDSAPNIPPAKRGRVAGRRRARARVRTASGRRVASGCRARTEDPLYLPFLRRRRHWTTVYAWPGTRPVAPPPRAPPPSVNVSVPGVDAQMRASLQSQHHKSSKVSAGLRRS